MNNELKNTNENKFNMLVDFIQKKFDNTTQNLSVAINFGRNMDKKQIEHELIILEQILDKIDEIKDYE